MTVIQNSLMNLFRRDPQGAVMGIFSQVLNSFGLDTMEETSVQIKFFRLFHKWFFAVLRMFLCKSIYVSFFVGNPGFMNLNSRKLISSKHFLE